jgi:hypothetical protein
MKIKLKATVLQSKYEDLDRLAGWLEEAFGWTDEGKSSCLARI